MNLMSLLFYSLMALLYYMMAAESGFAAAQFNVAYLCEQNPVSLIGETCFHSEDTVYQCITILNKNIKRTMRKYLI